MRKAENFIKLEFPSRSVNEALARGTIAAFLVGLDPTIEELADIKTAVSEAVTNCVVHAYPTEIGKIYIAASLFDDGQVVIKIKDKGCGIPNVKQAMEPLFTTRGQEERSGLGFSVMQSLVDKVSVRSKMESGTTVTLQKRLRSKGEA